MAVYFILAYIGGALTILSPCILPVLPFVFGGAGQPFCRGALPLLAGMALTFAAVSTLAVVGGSWVVQANNWGRVAALVFLSLFAVSLLFPALAERITRPLTRLGGSLQPKPGEESDADGTKKSFLLGIATGLLWAPCAGPILGLILTGAALQGTPAKTAVLLLAYALGSATSLSVILLAGDRVLKAVRGNLGVEEVLRRVIGVFVLVGVAAIALGWDRGVLTRLSKVRTEGVEEKLLAALKPKAAALPETNADIPAAPLGALVGATGWINSPSLALADLRGKVVLIDFWTYSCINCLRTLPYVKAWHAKYKDSGLVIIGVHAPEFAFEKDLSNVQQAVKDLGITYPVALDNNYRIWNAFSNRYWPAHYFIDAEGRIRGSHFGEGRYDESEHMIQKLLMEARLGAVPSGVVDTKAQGIQAAASGQEVKSPETYIGSSRSENRVPDPNTLALNQWGLDGDWTINPESAHLNKSRGKIRYRFHARDLHLVLGPRHSGRPVRFIVRLDGHAPGENHGDDIDASGQGRVEVQRLYQLIRQKSDAPIEDHTFEIEFLDRGVEAFAFTFG